MNDNKEIINRTGITKNEIVKYQNTLNQVSLRRFNATDMNIFYSVVSRVRDKDTNRVVLSYSYLKKLSKYSKHADFTGYLKQLTQKLQTLSVESDDGTVYRTFVLFTEFEANRKTRTLTVSVNPKFTFFFNDLNREFTRFSLNQYTTFRSSYSKTAFRLIKQYRTIGKREFSIDEFRRLMDIPKSYRISDIDRRILKIVKEELSPVIPGLAITKIKVSGKRGRKVGGYAFSWKPEKPKADDFSYNQILDQKKAIANIEHNQDLTEEEKNRAIDRLMGFELGTTANEQPFTIGIREIDAEEEDQTPKPADQQEKKQKEAKHSTSSISQLNKRLKALEKKQNHHQLTDDEELELVQLTIKLRRHDLGLDENKK